MQESERINGWKAIGAFFGRDRTTVMRWAQYRGLPVYKMPVGKSGSVYALKSELSEWERSANLNAELNTDGNSLETIIESSTIKENKFFNKRVAIFLIGGTAIASIFGVGSFYLMGKKDSKRLPSNPKLVTKYLKARDLWAQRNAVSINESIKLLKEITQSEPSFKDGFAALADAYLLSREFGAIDDETAFESARIAAKKAFALDKEFPAANRALGFISYWWDKECSISGEYFKRALSYSSNDAQTHFWYGNILSDNGQHAKAIKELNTARLIEPGSIAIQTDLAYVLWASGDEQTAKAMFDDLLKKYPNFAGIHYNLSDLYIGNGDYIGYIQSLEEYGKLTNSKDILENTKQLKAALKIGASEVQALVMKFALDEIKRIKGQTHTWAVFLSSIALNRQQTIDLLIKAVNLQEKWGSAGYISRIKEIWFDDKEINSLIQKLKAPLVP